MWSILVICWRLGPADSISPTFIELYVFLTQKVAKHISDNIQINTSGTDRYSIPFFYDGASDCVIKPLDGSKGKAFTVEEHMLSRYKATYG